MAQSWSIKVHKDYLKFSAAHFLVFPDGTAETLHGHNYKVYVEVRSALDAHGMVLNFREIKPLISEVVAELDERMIVPGQHPVLTIREQGDGSSRIDYLDRYYVIPTAELVVLPINNTSAENLARYVATRLLERLHARYENLSLRELIVGVEETAGQQGVYHHERDPE